MSEEVIRKEEIVQDIEKGTLNGFLGLGLHLLLGIFNAIILASGSVVGALIIITGPLWLLYTNSYVIIQPNEAKALQFFGKYSGTVRVEGFRFLINPLYQKTGISLRIRNFESNKLKVNDVNANPVEIAAVVVWRVFDAAEALFEVDNYNNYVIFINFTWRCR